MRKGTLGGEREMRSCTNPHGLSMKTRNEARHGEVQLEEWLLSSSVFLFHFRVKVKTQNGARYTAMTKDLAAKRARCEQIKNIISDQRNKVDECTTIISKSLHALEACEEKIHQGQSEKENLDSAIAWYQHALGLRVVEEEGVKFIFNKIDPMNPDKDYSFTVQLDNDKYNLLQCDPHVEGIVDLLKEVNKTNDFFRFVRVMREKFASNEPSPATPLVAETGAKSKKGLKTPTSSIRRSARLRNVHG